MKPSETKPSTKKSSRKKSDTYETFAREVLEWYQVHGRHTLPWRKSITPYKILVSEIMLQQTQVVRVLPKYELWMKKYPTLISLSQASLQEILVLWQGLGYQRRARALLTIAKTQTKLPKSYQELLALPGIGEYTASAMMAFAYNTFEHMLETNIRTALVERFHNKKSAITDEVLKKDLKILIELPEVKKCGAREWYCALMDYGAYLKAGGISHNTKIAGYKKQTAYEGSFRKLRAETLFAITHNKALPIDARVPMVLTELKKEGFIKRSTKDGWVVV